MENGSTPNKFKHYYTFRVCADDELALGIDSRAWVIYIGQ